MKAIRVLHVIGRRPTGGVGSFVLNMLQNINPEIVTFDFAICSSEPDGPFDRKVRSFGSAITILPELKIRNTAPFIRELRSFYKNCPNYDIVHVHTPNIAVPNFYFAWKRKIPCRILHSHSIKYSTSKMKCVRNFFLQLPARRMATHYMACAESAGVFLFGQKAMREGKVFIAKNAIDTQRYTYNDQTRLEVRGKLGLTDELVVGSIGRLSKEKNYPFLLKIIQGLTARNPKFRLLLVGEGDERQHLESLVDDLNLRDAVVMTGACPDAQRYYQAFDLFILTSFFEGLPLTGVEAQASDLPCVFSNTITRELQLTQKVDYVSLSDSPAQWGEVILRALSPLQARVNRTGDIEKAGYDIRMAAQTLTDYYRDIIKGSCPC